MKNSLTRQTSNTMLISLYQNGDRDALKLLINRFHPIMVRTITYYTRNPGEADDLAQECWYTIIKKLDGLELKISFEAWALTIARRKSIDWIRNQQRLRKQEQILIAETESTPEDSEPDEPESLLEKVQAGIRDLSPSRRIVIQMFYLESMSLGEISTVLKIPEGTVKSRLFDARETLKKLIK
ncbi:MAG: RNA polymerase sigma factor [Rhodothermaceae bacterium]|nr:RNA polymerase sigma factor [Rhodothermaceae bacterium]